jgi:AraC-like DNA-binding protein
VVGEVLSSGVLDVRADSDLRMAGLTPLLEDYSVCSLNVYEYQMATPYDNANQMKNLRRFIGGSVARAMEALDAGDHLFVDQLRGNLVLIARCGPQVCEEALRRVSKELFDTFALRSDFVISARHHGAAELFTAYCESQGIQLVGDAFSLFDDAELRLIRHIQELKRQMTASIAKDTPAQVGAKLRMVADMLIRGHDANAMAISFCSDLIGLVAAMVLDPAGEPNREARPRPSPGVARVSDLLPDIARLERALSEYHAECLRRRASDLVAATKRFIQENLADTTQESVAAHVGVSAIYLSVLFKEETGENFRDYLIAAKIHRAKKLLKETDSRIYEIALQSGYSDIKYFSKNFRRLVGCSPNEYRAAARTDAILPEKE